MAPSKRRRCTPITTAILLAVGMTIAAWLAYRSLHTPGTTRRVFRQDARPLKSDDTVDDQIFLGDTPPPTDLVVIQPSHRLLQAPPVTWQSTLAPLDLTVMIPMIAVTEPNAQRVLLIAQSLLPLASSMSLEVILLTELTPATAASSDPHRYLDLFLANTSFKQLVTVHRVAPASPWFAPTVGAMLQHGLNVSRGRRVLVMTPYVKPREDFFLRLLDSKADVVSCSLLAHDDVIMHRGYVVSALGAHEGRLELERVDYAMKLTQKPNPPPPRAHQRLFPSLHCALFDRQRLQRAGGFTTHASTLIDSLRQGLIHNTSAARQHWKHEIEVQVGQFQFSASSIEVHQLKSLSNDARKVFYQLDKYSVMASALSKRLLGVAIEQNLLQLLQEQRIITNMPLSISDMMIEVAFRVTAVMKLVEQLTLPSTSPLDWLAWDVTARMGVDTRVDIRRDAIAELHAPQSTKPADDSSSDVWDDVLSQRLERSLIFECPLPTALRDNILQQVVGGKKPLEAQDQHHK